MNTKPCFDKDRVIDPIADQPPASCISPVFDGARQRDAQGRFHVGVSGNPHGRPRGSLNKSTLFAHLLTETNISNLANKAMEAALSGNTAALKICMARALPVPKDVPVPFALIETGNVPSDLLAAHDHVVRRMAAGEITPKQAQSISRILEARRRCWESVSIAERKEGTICPNEGERLRDKTAEQSQKNPRAE